MSTTSRGHNYEGRWVRSLVHLAMREGVGVEIPGMEALQSVVDGKVTPETYSREYLEGVVNRLFVSLRKQKGMEQLFQELAAVRQPSTIPPARVHDGERAPQRLGQALFDRTANNCAEATGLLSHAEHYQTTKFYVSDAVRKRLLRLSAVFRAILQQSPTTDVEINRSAIECFLNRAEQDLKMINELKDISTVEDFVAQHDEIIMKTVLAQMQYPALRQETSELSRNLHLMMVEDDNRRMTIQHPQRARALLTELHLTVNDTLCPYAPEAKEAFAAVVIPAAGVSASQVKPQVMSLLPFFTKVTL